MHPAPSFAWEDRVAMRAFVAEHSFGLLVASGLGQPRMAHVPVVWLDDARLGFHLARNNPIVQGLDGADVLFTVLGAHGYISPDWYGLDDQVPTWNYISVELGGVVRLMDAAATMDQLDRLSAVEEARLHPKTPWTRAKMSAGLSERMARGIHGYVLEVSQWQGTRKLGQNKNNAVRQAAAAGVDAAGGAALAAAMRATVTA